MSQLLEAIIRNWPDNGAIRLYNTDTTIVACKHDYETEYIIQKIQEAKPTLDREIIIAAMLRCCKEIAPPYYPRPFLLCLLRRLGIG